MNEIVAAQATIPDSAVTQRQSRPLQQKIYDRVINMYVYLILNYLYQTRYCIYNSVGELEE